jgi:hypothetical protein
MPTQLLIRQTGLSPSFVSPAVFPAARLALTVPGR